jgi:hypothetical protein
MKYLGAKHRHGRTTVFNALIIQFRFVIKGMSNNEVGFKHRDSQRRSDKVRDLGLAMLFMMLSPSCPPAIGPGFFGAVTW